MKAVRYHRGAVRDFFRACRRYRRGGPALGERFISAFEEAVEARNKSHRRRPENAEAFFVRLEGFPYKIVFLALPHCDFIVAVHHQHRRPGYWTRRLRDL